MNEKKQVRLNLITNIVNLILSVIVGIVYTPYLVRTLGITAYGILPLALIINQYISVFTNSLTSSLTRFYSIALQKNDKSDASLYLSTSFLVVVCLIVLISPFIVLIILRIDNVFNIPNEYINSARMLFILTFLSFISSLISSILNISLYAYNKLDKINYIKITRLLLKFILVIGFFEVVETDIIYIGYSNLIAELAVLVISSKMFNRITPEGILIRMKFFDKLRLMSVLGMTIWVLIHQFGDTALYRTDNILVNIFWSTKESGILGALSEFGSYVILIVGVLSSIFGPLILISYSRNEHSMVESLSLDNSLTVGVLAAILVGVLIGFAKPIIYFWLGPDFTKYSFWLVIKLVSLPAFAASGIFAFTYRAWNQVRFPAIATIILGLFNLLITYILYYFFSNSASIIPIALTVSCILIIIQSYGLNAYWFNKLYKGNSIILFRNFSAIQLVMIISICISLVLNFTLNMRVLPVVLVSMVVSGAICLLITFYWILNKTQKKIIIQLIR